MKTFSMTEWLQGLRVANPKVSPDDVQELIDQDLNKWPRLHMLRDALGLPIDEHTHFSADDILNQTKKFNDFFTSAKSNRFSIKAEPKDTYAKTLHRVRKHGVTKEECVEFTRSLAPSPQIYKLSIWENHRAEYSGIFLITDTRAYVEWKHGEPSPLTQGTPDYENVLHTEQIDLRVFPDPSTLDTDTKIIYDAVRFLDARGRKLPFAVNITGYVKGYFEFIYYADGVGYRFIDFTTSRLMNSLAALLESPAQQIGSPDITLKGLGASGGVAQGRVVVVKSSDDFPKVLQGNVLVAHITTPEFLPVFGKIAAIVTDFGGLTSHPAIMARELKIPCIVNTKDATSTLHDGDTVEVDGTYGSVRRL